MAGATWRRYWPWWLTLGWLLGYEGYAVVTHHPTLSQMVWHGEAAFPALIWIVVPVVVVLLLHFFAGLWK